MAEGANSSGLLAVRLVTPDRLLLDCTADAVELPSASGYMEALYGAAPLLAELGSGEVRLHGGTSGEQKFFVAWGFVEVLPERVTILAETALPPNDIDVAAAQQDVQAKVARIRRALPPDIDEPIVQHFDPNDSPIVSLAIQSSERSLRELTDLADESVITRLEAVPGVGAVNRTGGAQRTIRIQLDPLELF